MARGGQRQGAGRKAGSPNKATAERQAEVEASGLTPLDFMLTVLRDDKQSMENRCWAAEKAAPFVHPKLAAVTVSGDEDNPLNHVHVVEFRIVRPGG